MPRTHSSVLSQGSSVVSSSSGASFHTAPESPRSIYPEMQARASDARGSETRRFPPNWWFSSQLEVVHDDDEEEEEQEDPRIIKIPQRRDPESDSGTSDSEDPGIIRLPPIRDFEPESDTSEFASDYSSHDSELEQPNISQPSLSDYTLEPSDSISNQDHRSNAGSIPRFAPPPSLFFATDNRYVDINLYESLDGALIKRLEPHCMHHPHGCQGHAANHSADSTSDPTDDSLGALRDLTMNPIHRARFSNAVDTNDLLAYYSEGGAGAGKGCGDDGGDGDGGSSGSSGDVSTRPEAYDDDFEAPFAPRGYRDGDGESCHEHSEHTEEWDDRQDGGREQEWWLDWEV